MKISIYKILLILPMLFFTQLSFGQYTKEIHKAWNIEKVKALVVEHKFGNINFTNKREDSVTIDIIIKIDNFSESKAKYLSEQLTFELEIYSGKVVAKTVFGTKFQNVKEFTIDYTINIPYDRNLEVSNKFGNVKLEDLTAQGTFDIKYGNIEGNRFDSGNDPITLELSYGNGYFDYINNLKAEVSYSKLAVDAIDFGTLETKYSGITIDEIKDLEVESKYDHYSIDQVSTIQGESKFTNWDIDELLSQFVFENEYGEIKIDFIPVSFNKIILDNEYGSIRFGIDNEATYFLKGETKYCNITFPDFEPTKRIKDNFYTYLEVNVGNDASDAMVDITSKYGNVRLTK